MEARWITFTHDPEADISEESCGTCEEPFTDGQRVVLIDRPAFEPLMFCDGSCLYEHLRGFYSPDEIHIEMEETR